jgi:hypothetical protein
MDTPPLIGLVFALFTTGKLIFLSKIIIFLSKIIRVPATVGWGGVQKQHPLLRAPHAAGARTICVGFADVTRIRRESVACHANTAPFTSSRTFAFPSSRTSASHCMGLAPSSQTKSSRRRNGQIKTERQRVSRDLAVTRVVLPGWCECCAQYVRTFIRCATGSPRIMQMLRAPAALGARNKGCYFWTPLFRSKCMYLLNWPMHIGGTMLSTGRS